MIVALYLLGWMILNCAWALGVSIYCLAARRHMTLSVFFVQPLRGVVIPLCCIALPGSPW